MREGILIQASLRRATQCFLCILLVAQAFATAAQGVQKVTIAGFGGNDVFAMHRLVNDVLAADFAAAGVQVDYFAVESDYPKYILNALSSGNAPDAFYVDINVAQSWIQTGNLAAVSEQLRQQRSGLIPLLTQSFSDQGQLYGIAKDVNALALVYNEDIFDDAGVDYPTNQDTWDDLAAKLQQVVTVLGDEGVAGVCLSPEYHRFAPLLFATGWQMFDAQGHTRLDDNFRRAFAFYVGLLERGLAVLPNDLGQRWGGGCFANERTAVTIEGYWLTAYLQDKSPNLRYGSVLMPRDPVSGERGNILFSAAWGINANSPNRQAIETVIRLLTSDKAQLSVLQAGLAIPSTQALATHPYFSESSSANRLAATIFAATEQGHVFPYAFSPYDSNWMEPIKVALSSVMLGQLGVDAALAEAQQQYDRMFEQLR